MMATATSRSAGTRSRRSGGDEQDLLATRPAAMPTRNTTMNSLQISPSVKWRTKTALKQKTVSAEPIGSTTIPSHVRIVATEPLGRAIRSSGMTTVGPDTTRIAPLQDRHPEGLVEQHVHGHGRQHPGDEDAQRDQRGHRAADSGAELAEPQLEPSEEEEDADGEGHHREQRAPEDLVRIDPSEPRAHHEAAGEQQHDRGEMEQAGQPLQSHTEDDDEADPEEDVALHRTATVSLAGRDPVRW